MIRNLTIIDNSCYQKQILDLFHVSLLLLIVDCTISYYPLNLNRFHSVKESIVVLTV